MRGERRRDFVDRRANSCGVPQIVLVTPAAEPALQVAIDTNAKHST
ncbi:hypothetical protein [Burkholderia ambifaria]|uniref:Uncharacterized protein n=1 Tax=Burkholderia ambifaria TaxID=152480 RepID=A0AA41JIN8_9BURK|nr:hypothetical protein [Burkholderia ambifaria]MBR8129006.1 hypothetical protein [Burkholderia ambifaria]